MKYLPVLLLVVSVATTGDSEVVGSQEPVKVEVGQDAILPCHLKPPFNVGDLTVEWKRNDMIVHIYRSHRDYLTDQDKVFRNRTSMFHHEMTKGNISLKLTNVTKDDSGNYTCFLPKLHSQVRRGYITLNVVEKGSLGDNTTAGDGGLGAGPITGIVIADIVICVIGVIGAIVLFRRKKSNAQRRDQVPTEPPDPAPGEPNIPGGGPGRSAHQRRDADHSDGADGGDGNSGRAKRRKRTSPKHSKRGRKTQKKRKNHY